MSFPSEQFCQGMHRYQRELFGAFDYRWDVAKCRKPQFFDCEWHRGARKTTALVTLLIKESCRIPNTKYIYLSPTQVQTRNIVWDEPTMLRPALPDRRQINWKMNEQKMLVTFENRSMLKFGGADEPESWRGLNAVGYGFDEWALMKPNTWSEVVRPIFARHLHPSLDMFDVYRWAAFIYTPKGMNHAATRFDSACCLDEGGILPVCGEAATMRENHYASRLDGELSGILSHEELVAMREEVARGEIPQAFYDQEIKCSRVTSEEMTLITTELIYELNNHHSVTEHVPYDTRRIVSIDPAWGGDVCKIMGLINNEIKEDESLLERHRTSEIVMAAKVVAQNIHTKNFVVDTVNAPGVADALAEDEAGYNVQYFKSSHKPREKDASQNAIRYANRRAEAYAYAARMIRTFGAGPIKSQRLMRGLPIASQYKTQGGSGKLIILPKADIKKGTKTREGLGRSPDDEDCYIMGLWGSQFVEPEHEQPTQYRDSYERKRGRSRRPESAMA